MPEVEFAELVERLLDELTTLPPLVVDPLLGFPEIEVPEVEFPEPTERLPDELPTLLELDELPRQHGQFSASRTTFMIHRR